MTQKAAHSDLVERCKNGDRLAQTQVYELYSTAMYNVAMRIVNDEFLAEDVMHEAFISAFGNIKTFKAEVELGAWLKRIVINRSLNELKREQRNLSFPEENWDIEETTEQAELDGLTVRQVHKAIKNLPTGYRVILSLYLLEGYDHEEIGQVLGIASSTSRSQYTRAKERLRKSLLNKD